MMARLFVSTILIAISGIALAGVGDPCQSDQQCGLREQCVTEFSKGYCVRFSCSSEDACANGSKCMSVQPENFTLCLKQCMKDADCRSGYRCHEGKVCLP